MSASEIIEQIKALPRDEQRLVAEFVREADLTGKSDGATRAERFQLAADAVFRKHDEALRRLAQ